MKSILIQHGLLPHQTSLGLPTRLDNSAVRLLADRLRKAVSLEAVEAELGVTSKVFGEIIAQGHIELLVKGGGRVRPLVDHDAAGSLMRKLKARLVDGPLPKSAVGIPLAAKSLCMPVAKVITEVLEGRLPVVAIGDKNGLAAIVIDVNGRRADYRRARTALMTARDVARRFGVKEEVAIALLRTGMIRSQRDGHHWLADRPSAEKFFAENALMIEYAPKLGTSAKYLNGFLEAHGIVPTFGPPAVDRKFFNRATAEGFFERVRLPRRISKKRKLPEPA